MHRRSLLVASGSVLVAGCSELPSGLGGAGGPLVDASVSQGNNVQFSANEGDELEVDVEVEELGDSEADDGDGGVEQRSVSVRIDGTGDQSGQYVIAESVEEQASFTATVPADGEYNVAVGGGTATVVVEMV